ncbi:hypothetical protein EV129_11319 [Rhizobium azibense]|uniref:Uncharacterized protein n=1 Tax=Rhizobium azibense TaxID=1136135 RepID=A0A4R3RR31_9HYPH|nr:hypothetical protein EV129_11319 [Rhizobium azibense]
MEALFQFAGNHPFLTWFIAWGIWPVCWTVHAVLTTPFRCAYGAYKRKLRSRDIQAHGWRTARLMDADGDIVHPPKEEKNG